MSFESSTGFFQRYNILIGIIISALFTSILYMIFPGIWFFFSADIFLVIGSCLGLYFTLKNRNESQSHIKTGVIVGLVGAILSLVLISFFIWLLYYIPEFGINFLLLLESILVTFLVVGVMFIIVGIIIGYLFGRSFRKKDTPATQYPKY